MCATTIVSTVAGYHVVLATLLFEIKNIFIFSWFALSVIPITFLNLSQISCLWYFYFIHYCFKWDNWSKRMKQIWLSACYILIGATSWENLIFSWRGSLTGDDKLQPWHITEWASSRENLSSTGDDKLQPWHITEWASSRENLSSTGDDKLQPWHITEWASSRENLSSTGDDKLQPWHITEWDSSRENLYSGISTR